MNLQLKKYANLAAVLLLIAVVAPFVVYAAPVTVGADHSFVVLTASMTPAIAPGDVVIVDERDPSTIAEGDVITFLRGTSETPVTHRVTAVTTSGGTLAFETKGDANDNVDSGLVPATNVIGTVMLTIPYIGYVIQFGNSTYGFIALVVIPFGLLLVTELWSIYASRRKTTTGADGTTDDPDTTADPGESATEVLPVSADATNGEEITRDTVIGAAAMLLPFAAYSGYTAYTLRSTLSISVTVATSVAFLGAIGLLLSAGRTPGTAVPATDGGTTAETGGDGDANVLDEHAPAEPWIPAMAEEPDVPDADGQTASESIPGADFVADAGTHPHADVPSTSDHDGREQ